MNISWITARHPPHPGGMAVSSKRISDGLRDRGCSVEIIYLNENPNRFNSNSARAAIIENWHRQKVNGINIPDDPEKIFWSLKNSMAKSVLVGFGGDYPGYLATLWGKWLKRPSVALFRGNDLEKSIHDGKKAWMVHFVLEHADVVGSVSREMKGRIESLRQKPVIYTPNSIDVSQWLTFDRDLYEAEMWRREMNLEDKPIVAVLGQLKAKKGLDFALQLFTNSNLGEKAYLLSVGDVPHSILKSQACDCDFWIRIPYQQKDRLPMWYSLADIVFIPSFYDGMPNVLLEAMAMGKIVVASRAGAIPDVIEHNINGFLFDINDDYSAYELIEHVTNMNKETLREIAQNARKTVELKHTPDIECGSLLDGVRAVIRDS